MGPVKCAIACSAFNVSGIVHQVIFFVDFSWMQLFGMISFNMPISWIDFGHFVVIVPPQIVGLKRVYMPIGFENSVFIDVFHLEFIPSLLQVLVLLGRILWGALGDFPKRVIWVFKVLFP